MQYDLNQLGDPNRFQRLVNTILTARFGEDARLTPLMGADGGSDGETASDNPYMEFRFKNSLPFSNNNALIEPPRPGRYLFQAKYHRTGEQRLSDLRAQVVREFEDELVQNVLSRRERREVNYFFVVTNVTASRDAIRKVDEVRTRLLSGRDQLHADIWWGERITASLDWSPDLWLAFPEIFPGGSPPLLASTSNPRTDGLSRTIRLAISHQYDRDLTVKFRQIELEQQLLDLFVDLDVELYAESDDFLESIINDSVAPVLNRPPDKMGAFRRMRAPSFDKSALEFLIDDDSYIRKLLLEGGPGQGKSTITQMAAQIYREKLLGISKSTSRDSTWNQLCRLRLPIRLELRGFAQWLDETADGTLEQYIARIISRDSGGVSVTVKEIHTFVERSSVVLLLDGLDEIGSDSLRDRVLDAIMETIKRFEIVLKVDLRVVLTTRPPALTGRRDKLDGFTRVVLTPMTAKRIDDYIHRWLNAQISTPEEQTRVKESFEARRDEPHVSALVRNPMQLSVLLQFIYLKGEAFPDRRAELYRDYFQIVIDRDVEKSPELRQDRDLVEGLHAFLGFRLHGGTEADKGRRTLNRREIIKLAGHWLEDEGYPNTVAARYFALGEERFGLIVAVSGEGDETTYGFEVQPIQEYFAASYISNRLADGSAHEIFELMIHRSYWREVALFLAGLRRPNEKADLIARAKAADMDVSEGWQQNGRAIVLQLLREGVLSQPRHVLTQAMDFVMELLDLRTLRVQRTPIVLTETICQLGKLYSTDVLPERIVDCAREYFESEDEDALAVIHRLAARLLPEEQYTPLVLGYTGTLEQTRSLVRMTCAYESVDTLEKLGTNQDYWAGASATIWARRFWREALRRAVVADVTYPAGLHTSLVVEFAVNHLVERGSASSILKIRAERPPAVWKLLQNLQVMRQEFSAENEKGRAKCLESTGSEAISEGPTSGGDVSFQGLSPQLESCLRELIVTSSDVICSLSNENRIVNTKKVEMYMQAITSHLGDPGLSGWVACRCGMEILRRRLILDSNFIRQELVDVIEKSLIEFYGIQGYPSWVTHRYPLQRFPFSMPSAVRLTGAAKPVPVDRILADLVRGKLDYAKKNDCLWVADIPLHRAAVKPLVESCRNDLLQLLRFVGERTMIGFPLSSRLMIQDTHRILKICRRTGDRKVLGGAATILLNSTFSGIAEPELIVKVLSAAPSSQLVARALNPTRKHYEKPGADVSEKKLNFSRNVARLILSDKERYPFRIVNSAARFIAETEATKSTPLFDERPELLRPPR